MDKIDLIIAYEGGELSNEDTVKLFSSLIKSGEVWSLQGHYGRMASRFIEAGIISKQGVINWDIYNGLVEA